VSVTKKNLKTLLYAGILTAVLCAGIPLAIAQTRTAIVLKSMGSLVMLDAGSSADVQVESSFRLYRASAEMLPDPTSSVNYLGMWTVTQVYPDFAVGRFLLAERGDIPEVATMVALFPFEMIAPAPEEVEPRDIEVALPPEPTPSNVLPAPAGITLTPGASLSHPVAVGFSVAVGYSNFSDEIVGKIRDFQYNDVFGGTGAFERTMNGRTGFGLDAQIMPKPSRGLRMSYRRMQVSQDLNGSQTIVPTDPTVEYTSSWDMETITTVHTIALTSLWGNFQPVYDQYFGDRNLAKPRRLGWYYGGGLDWARIGYRTKERAGLAQGEDERFVNNNQSFTMGNYWGAHALGGLTWNFPAVRTFVEMNLIYWGDRDFGFSIPFRAGFEIFF
jgi:hypothetical protein